MTETTPKAAQPASPATRYLQLIARRILAIRRDIPHLVDLGQRMADLLVKGGQLCAPGMAPFWPSECCCRAGGMMGIQRAYPQSRKDIACFALPDPRRWNAAEDKGLQQLIDGKGQLFVVGRPEDLLGIQSLDRFAGFTGGVDPDKGLYALPSRRPLASLREFEIFVRGWILNGEMIAACIRAGKMPLIWMSVWLEGALPRNASFLLHDNLREPWQCPIFHDNRYIPPLAPGYVANAFLTELQNIHRIVLTQVPQLATAGEWFAHAHEGGRRPYSVAVGHAYPAILELRDNDGYPVQWGSSISDLSRAMPANLGRGDVALHLGYAPVDGPAVSTLLKRGLRFIHSSPYGRPANLKPHPNFLWLELPWRPADATVDVPGYSVRILPMSSSAQTMVYFAILAEMADRLAWK